jgi:hypothetical protein
MCRFCQAGTRVQKGTECAAHTGNTLCYNASMHIKMAFEMVTAKAAALQQWLYLAM